MTNAEADSLEFLYHHTNASEFKGIIESRTIWATDAEFLNDTQELRFGRPELITALEKRATN